MSQKWKANEVQGSVGKGWGKRERVEIPWGWQVEGRKVELIT